MNVTNILSSHYPGSFIQGLHDTFNMALEAGNHQATTINLYAEGFDPVMKGEDFNPFFGKPVSPEIAAIHELLGKTDILTFFYPVWWNDMPAIMKGWIDRVFVKDFAYEILPEGARGILAIKKVLLVCTLGNKKEEVDPALEEAMRVKERDGVFTYSGISEVEHHFFYNVGDPKARETYLTKMAGLASGL